MLNLLILKNKVTSAFVDGLEKYKSIRKSIKNNIFKIA
jgi:hypothetical protein